MVMDIGLIIKIAAVGILVAILNQLLIHSGREETAMMTTIAGLIIVMLMIVNLVNKLFATVKAMFEFY